MPDNIFFTVSGNPIPKQSFRFRNGQRSYQPARIKAWQNMVAAEAYAVMIGKDKLVAPLRVSIHFRRDNRRRVDLDNLSKAVLDAMNGIVYQDDQQIHELRLSKEIDKDNPGVDVRIWTMGIKDNGK